MVVDTTTMVNKPQSRHYVIKRDGRTEEVHFDKITSRIQKLCYNLNMDFVDPVAITLKVINGLYPGVTTVELDTLAAEIAATMATEHPDYATLAARIAVSNLQKETKKQFSDVINDLYNAVESESGKKVPQVSKEHHEIVMKNASRLNSIIIYTRDFSYSYFGFKTLESQYLLRINGKIVERPQHMLMRVAVGIHGEDIDAAIETYNYLSEHYFTHSSHTLLFAATPKPQLASSLLLMMPSDSIEGIFHCITQCSHITCCSGDISINMQNIRAKGTRISGTGGVSNGLVPLLRCYDTVAEQLQQNRLQTRAQFTIYLEPWHSDVFEFLLLKKPTGAEELRARKLSYALWIPDLFMKRVEAEETWSLMCPHKCPGLSDSWGEKFETLYLQYEQQGNYVRQVSARDLWTAIIASQIETGSPAMLYKDTCNRNSNQQNLGAIKSGSYSAGVVAFTSPDEIAVCNTAYISVDRFVKPDKSYDFALLKSVTKVVTKNLNKIIDINHYALAEEETASKRHRAIGIGIQGLADAFILSQLAYESDEAALLNKQIFETLYYGALEASYELAKEAGPYSTYEDSPVSKGLLQFDLCNPGYPPSELWNWSALKTEISQHGVRNSLLIAATPSTGTSQILGNSDGFQPYTAYVNTFRVSSGEFVAINPHLLKDLTDLGMWDKSVQEQILSSRGSVQNIPNIPGDLKNIYKTAWEIPKKTMINMAADRGAFIDQSQSFNIHMENVTLSVLSVVHFYGWRKGLKTGMYCLHTKPNIKQISFVVGGEKKHEGKNQVVNGVENGEQKIGNAPDFNGFSNGVNGKHV